MAKIRRNLSNIHKVMTVYHLRHSERELTGVKGEKTEKAAMIKVHIGRLLYNSVERKQPRQPPLRNVQQQLTSSLSAVETDSQSEDVGSSSRSLEVTNRHRRLTPQKNPVQKQYSRQNNDGSGRVESEDCVS